MQITIYFQELIPEIQDKIRQALEYELQEEIEQALERGIDRETAKHEIVDDYINRHNRGSVFEL